MSPLSPFRWFLVLVLAAAPGRMAFGDADSPPVNNQPVVLQFKATHHFLNLPVRIGGPVRVGRISIDGKDIRTFEVQLADGAPDWWAPEDISPWLGQTVTLTLDRVPADSKGPSLIDQTDAPKLPADFHHEIFRPQFHLSAPYGFELDVEGGFYVDGLYHLFYDWSNLCTRQGSSIWGHAVSPDLVHWKDVDTSWPERDMWSGTSVIDWNNTSGFGKNGRPPIVLFFTRPGKAPSSDKRPGEQCLVYSTDGGKTMTDYPGNPVVPKVQDTLPRGGPNRDPKVFWYEPAHEWGMVIFVALPGSPGADVDDRHSTFRFLTSPNLRDWTLTDCAIEGLAECPDFYELPVDGDPANKKWVLSDAGGRYYIGTFDGKKFTPETPRLRNFSGAYYAGQGFDGLPKEDGRRIKMLWMPGSIAPGMTFASCMSIPMVQSIITTPQGPRLVSWPVQELDRLHRGDPVTISNRLVREGDDPLEDVKQEGVELDLDLDLMNAKGFDLIVEGMQIRFDAQTHDLTAKAKDSPFEWHAPLEPDSGGHIHLRAFSDKTSLEIFAQKGLTVMAVPNLATPWSKPKLGLRSTGGLFEIDSLKVYAMGSVWGKL